MKIILRTLSIACAALFFSSLCSAADDIQVAVVNVNELFNKSAFVQKANKILQENAKKMELKLKAEQDKLQKQIGDYQKMKNSAKKNQLAESITTEQVTLSNMTKEYQSNISAEQNKGMQEFTQRVEVAVQKIAKDKKIHTVLNSSSIIFSDNTWVDITKDVETLMNKE